MTTLASAPVQSDPDASGPDAGEGGGRRVLTWIATNRLFTMTLAVGFAMRVIVMVAYPPALEFFGDSPSYLLASDHLGRVDIWHPPGYPVLLRIVSITGSLAVLTTLQHLLGLVAAFVVYRLARRLGTGAVGGTIATLPLLLDAYQLDVEQFVLSETLFIVLLVAAISAALRINDSKGLRLPITLGVLLASLTLTRTVGLFVAVAVGIVLVVQRVGARRLFAASVAFAIPVLGYALAFNASYGAFGLQGYSGRYLYGMVAPYATCSGDQRQDAGRILCPSLPTYARPGLNQYVWESRDYNRLTGTEIERSAAAGRFARRVIRDQPGATASVVAHNFAHYFDPGRDTGVRDWFAQSWQFPLPGRAPAWNISPAIMGFHRDIEHGTIRVGPARFLRDVQDYLYTPGPLLLAAIVLVLIVGVRRRAPRPARHGIVLLAGTGLLLLIVPSATAGFDWRYLLPAQTLLVPAGVIAARSLVTELTWRRPIWVRRWRLPAIIGAAAVFTTTVAVSPSIAEQRIQPGPANAVPWTASVSSSLAVRIGRPSIDTTDCLRTNAGYRTAAVASFPVTATHHGAGETLVEPADFSVAGQDPYQSVIVANPDLPALLPSAVLSSRFPRLSGRLYVQVFAERGRLRYVDPLGHGAAAWTFRLPDESMTQHVGRTCKPAPPPPLPGPRLARLAPFTISPQQLIFFGPAHRLPPIGTTYDVRWLSRSPTRHAGVWQFPPAWQRTGVRSLTLSNLQAGVTYCFSARTHRPSGRTTSWSTPRCATRLADDTALAATAGWRRFSGSSGFYGETYTATRQSGAILSAAGSARRVAVAAYRCPGCGTLEILIDGHIVKRLDLNSRAQQGVFTWISHRHRLPGRVELRSFGTGLVAVDAVGLQP